jgi:Flp pilus assembly protein TadG
MEEIVMKENKNINPREEGQSLVELAMSLILLLTLLAGLVDFGRAFFTYVALRDAAQEGASFASVINDDAVEDSGEVAAYCQSIRDRVLITTSDLNGGSSSGPVNLQALSDAGQISVETTINGTECTSLAASDICMGGAVTVRVTYDSFPVTTPLLGTILGTQNLTIDTAVSDSILTPACQ